MAIRLKHGESLVLTEAKECSKCGCKDRVKRDGQQRCRHCGKLWVRHIAPASDMRETEQEHEPIEGVTYYHVLRCPSCGSKKTKITSTRKPIRHHKCKDCGHNFKSTER